MTDLSALTSALHRRLKADALHASEPGHLEPLARRVIGIQRVLLDSVAQRFAGFRESIEDPIAEVERAAASHFEHVHFPFGSLWMTSELSSDRDSEHAKRVASAVDLGHLLLAQAIKRVRGDAEADRYFDQHTEMFAREAVVVADRIGADVAGRIVEQATAD